MLLRNRESLCTFPLSRALPESIAARTTVMLTTTASPCRVAVRDLVAMTRSLLVPVSCSRMNPCSAWGKDPNNLSSTICKSLSRRSSPPEPGRY